MHMSPFIPDREAYYAQLTAKLPTPDHERISRDRVPSCNGLSPCFIRHPRSYRIGLCLTFVMIFIMATSITG